MKKKTLYKQSRVGKIQQWRIWVEPQGNSGYPELWVEFGQLNGKLQTTFDIVSEGVNIGKANETTPLEQACLMLERKVVKQKEEGYRDTQKEAQAIQTIDWNERLPKNLCFYKPKNSIDDKKIAKLEESKVAVFSVKRDGMCHIIRKSDKFGVEIYSRRMDLVSDKYPHIVKSLEKVRHNFILLGEMILDKDGKDDFNGVSKICRSDSEKAIERQKELGKVRYYVFDMAAIEEDGSDNILLHTTSYIDRLDVFDCNVDCHLDDTDLVERCELLNYDESMVEVPLPERRTNMTHKEAMDIIKKRKLEGLVIWDANATMEEGSAYTFNGKAYRPNCLWKSKPRFEDDFIARFDPDNDIGEYGSGKNNGKVKSVFLYQLDNNGNEVYVCKCGGGFSDEQRTYYTTAKYPRVFRVLYDSIQKDGSLRFPVFDVDRDDKSIEECLLNDKIKKAKGL